MLPDLTQHVEAVHSRKHHVEDDGGIAALQDSLQSFRAIVDEVHRITQRREILAQQPAQLHVIIDDEKLRQPFLAAVIKTRAHQADPYRLYRLVLPSERLLLIFYILA